MADTAPTLISVDWGTTSFRAYLVAADGSILGRSERADGVLSVKDGDFAGVLRRAVAPWLASHGRLRIILSGMIGSRQGWVEAPYVECPAGTADIAAGMVPVKADGFAGIGLVPGLLARAHGLPDVMRGEETQVLGALARAGAEAGLYVLPGTHAKWVTVRAGRIVGFETYMTGEVFGALKDHTILGRLMSTSQGTGTTGVGATPGAGAGLARGIETGARAGHPGALLNRLFSTRTLALTGGLAAEDGADYLSGLLIGAELAAATAGGVGRFEIIAGAGLAERYLAAARLLGLAAGTAPADCVVAGQLALVRSTEQGEGR